MSSISRIVLQISVLVLLLRLNHVLGHCKIVHAAPNLNSSDQIRSHGFGVNLKNKFPWVMSQPGDAGADSGVYVKEKIYVEHPNPPCGTTAAWGPLDIEAWLSQADGLGVATTDPDGKFEALIFQVNFDGGGECTCEYDTEATTKTWNKCKTLVHPPGINGMWPQNRVNHTAVFQLPRDAVCRGGAFKDKCIVRVRCGSKLRFGSCLAIKTPASPPKLQLKVVDIGARGAMTAKTDLAQSDVSTVAAKVFDELKTKGVLVSSKNLSRHTKRSRYIKGTLNSATARKLARHMHTRRAKSHRSRAPKDDLTSLITAKAHEISLQVVGMMKEQGVMLIENKADLVLKEYSQSE